MSNRQRDLSTVLLPAALAAGALLIAGYLVAAREFSVAKELGFLSGLFCGAVSFALGVARRTARLHLALRTAEIVMSPFGFLLILPFTVTLAGGFFLGGSTSYCMAWAVTKAAERWGARVERSAG